jgi:hypothetical protein
LKPARLRQRDNLNVLAAAQLRQHEMSHDASKPSWKSSGSARLGTAAHAARNGPCATSSVGWKSPPWAMADPKVLLEAARQTHERGLVAFDGPPDKVFAIHGNALSHQSARIGGRPLGFFRPEYDLQGRVRGEMPGLTTNAIPQRWGRQRRGRNGQFFTYRGYLLKASGTRSVADWMTYARSGPPRRCDRRRIDPAHRLV